MPLLHEVAAALKSTAAAATQPQRSLLGWSLVAQGVAYVAVGLTGVLAPSLICSMLFSSAPATTDGTAWVRAAFGLLAYIGALYGLVGVFDQHDASRSFSQMTIFGRLVLSPPLIIFLIIMGLPVGVGVFFLVADPILALCAASALSYSASKGMM